MEVKTIVLDTNTYAEFKKGNPDAVQIIKNVHNIILTPIVLGELVSGFILGNKENTNRIELNQFLQSSKVLVVRIDFKTSEQYAKIYKELRYKGKPIPTNDMWIAASAKQFDLPIFTYDNHFNEIDDLKTISKPSDLF
jgi:tRNA(fMet)-specific endonuclease VapC